MKGNQTTRTSGQSGIVSLMVTMVLMIVITLIVLGFAQISRREQRQSLDRQLSMQAFLAAESAVNDARSAVRSALSAGTPIQDKSECGTSDVVSDPDYDANYPFNPELDAANKVRYTCMLVSTRVPDLQGPVPADGSSVNILLRPAVATDVITRIRINWTAPAGTLPSTTPAPTGCSASAGSFPRTSGSPAWNCPYGVLRTDIVPMSDLTRGGLMAGQRAVFLYPTSGGGAPTTQDYTTARGKVAGMSCNSGGGCTIDITNVSGSSEYALRLGAVYRGGTFTVSAFSAGSTPVMLAGSQVLIDATGRAQDVLRRVQVRLSITPNGDNGNGRYAIESASTICKRFRVTPSANSFQIMGDIIGHASKSNNPMCKPGSSTPTPTPTPTPLCNTVASTHSGDIAVASTGEHTTKTINLASELKGGCTYQFMYEIGDYHPAQQAVCEGGEGTPGWYPHVCETWKQPKESFYFKFITSSGVEIPALRTAPSIEIPDRYASGDPDVIMNPNGIGGAEAKRIYLTVTIPVGVDISMLELTHSHIGHPAYNSAHLYDFIFTPVP